MLGKCREFDLFRIVRLLRFTVSAWPLLFVLGYLAGCASKCAAQDKLRVVISFDAGKEIFPEAWRSDRIAASAQPLSQALQPDCARLVTEELDKYPVELLNRNIKRVFLLGGLGFSGIKASGTSSRKNIYLTYRGPKGGSSEMWTRRVLHSELSSILLRNHRRSFPKAKWVEQHPSGFAYGNGGVTAVQERKTGEFFAPALLRDGFVGRYSQSSLENDFNAIAGQLFLGSSEIWQAADEYSAIHRKVSLAIEFYSGLNPALDREYFRSLSAHESLETGQSVGREPGGQ